MLKMYERLNEFFANYLLVSRRLLSLYLEKLCSLFLSTLCKNLFMFSHPDYELVVTSKKFYREALFEEVGYNL